MDNRVRRFVLTMHNYQNELWTKEKLMTAITSLWLIDYAIIGEEITEQNSIPHYQIYIEYTNPTTQSQVIERFNKITKLKPHVEVAKGDGSSNKIYCSKSQNFLEHGTLSQKIYTDDIAVNVITLLHKGESLLQILLSNKSYATYIVRNFKNLQQIESTIRVENPPLSQIDEGDLPF